MKEQGTAVALGFFDGVHRGHQAVLGQAVALGAEQDLLPCAFTFTTQHSRPDSKRAYTSICTEEERAELIHMQGIQQIFCPEFETIHQMGGEEFVRDLLVGTYHARAVCCGRDFRFGRRAAWSVTEMATLCERYGAQLYLVPAVLDGGEPVSSTRIRQLLRQGEVQQVGRLLGRPYGFSFEVVHGKQLGRQFGFPTANQHFPNGFTLPRLGVYASFAWVDACRVPAVTNIGVHPTIQGASEPIAETFIPGLKQDLYGRRMPVELAAFLRPEVQFSSVEQLRAQMELDQEQAARICAHVASCLKI